MCTHTHADDILTPSSLIPLPVTVTFPYFPPFVCGEENESGRKEERGSVREGWKDGRAETVWECQSDGGWEEWGGAGEVAGKVGMKVWEESVVPGIENERGSAKTEWWEKRREEEDLDGETLWAINKVNRRQLRDKRETFGRERNKRSERGSRWNREPKNGDDWVGGGGVSTGGEKQSEERGEQTGGVRQERLHTWPCVKQWPWRRECEWRRSRKTDWMSQRKPERVKKKKTD